MPWVSELRKALLNSVTKTWQKTYRLYGVRKNVELGENVHLGLGTVLWAPSRLSVGNDVYIGKYCTLECDGSIGNHVLIANQVGLIGRHDHDFSTVGLPMRRAPWIGDPHYRGPGLGLRIVVEDDVWIGFGSIVLSGVRIHRGAIVAAGSVVTRDVPPYSIVAGNPARTLRKRFDSEDSIRRHEACLYKGAEGQQL